MAIIVLQHSDHCKPGRVGLTLRDHAFRLEIIRPDKGEPIPADLDDVDGVVSLGGPQSAYDSTKWIQQEIEFLREAHNRSLPIVGVCLGHQLLGKALGAEVAKMEKPEVGLCPVDILPAGQTDTILAGVAWRAPMFQIHNDHVTDTPPGATLLASSKHCKVQAFRAGLRSYGFQFHLEADREIMNTIVADSPRDLQAAGVSQADIKQQADKHFEMFSRLSDRICLNIATCLIPKVATVMQ
jgi:GMP synthase-like glutamine amidotransferase